MPSAKPRPGSPVVAWVSWVGPQCSTQGSWCPRRLAQGQFGGSLVCDWPHFHWPLRGRRLWVWGRGHELIVCCEPKGFWGFLPAVPALGILSHKGRFRGCDQD